MRGFAIPVLLLTAASAGGCRGEPSLPGKVRDFCVQVEDGLRTAADSYRRGEDRSVAMGVFDAGAVRGAYRDLMFCLRAAGRERDAEFQNIRTLADDLHSDLSRPGPAPDAAARAKIADGVAALAELAHRLNALPLAD